MEKSEIRTRFAPSPTGVMHIGNLRTALYAYLVARKDNGKFIVRIEDTDQERYEKGSIEKILAALQWVGIEIDEGVTFDEKGRVIEKGEFGPYFQSKRLDIYKKHIDALIEKSFAYYCFCSKDRLNDLRKTQQDNKQPPMYDKCCLKLSPKEIQARIEKGRKYVIRLNVDHDKMINFEDLVYGNVSVNGSTVDDQVLIKSDGFPTYHFAVVVDDHLMKISHIVRGEDWLPSTAKHVLLYDYLGWEMPQIVHVPNILAENKKKLSKRKGDVSVEDFKKKGYLPEAIVNFITLLGWNPKNDKELFSLDELEKIFDISGLNKAGAIFDYKKLDWMNAQYLKKLKDEDLTAMIVPVIEKYCNDNDYEFIKEVAEKIVQIEAARLKKISDITKNIEYYFKTPHVDAEMLPWKKCTEKEAASFLKISKEIIENISVKEFSLEEIQEKLLEAAGEKKGEMLWPLRVALTGQKNSPSPFEVAWIIGKNESIKRIDKSIDVMLEK